LAAKVHHTQMGGKLNVSFLRWWKEPGEKTIKERESEKEAKDIGKRKLRMAKKQKSVCHPDSNFSGGRSLQEETTGGRGEMEEPL